MDLDKHIKGHHHGPASPPAKPCKQHNPSSWSPRTDRRHSKQLLKSRRRNSCGNLSASSLGLPRTHRCWPNLRSLDHHLCMAEAPGLVPQLDLGRRHNSYDNFPASSLGLPRTHRWRPNFRSPDCHLCRCLVPVSAHMSAHMSAPVSVPESVPELVPGSVWTTR